MDWQACLGEAGLDGILFPLTFTAKVAVISVVLHLFFGLLLGYYLSRGTGTVRSVLDALITLPLVFPPIALGFLLLLIMGKTGVVGGMIRSVFGVEIIFSLYGVVIAAFVAGLPLIVKPVQTAIQNTAASLIDASYTLGQIGTGNLYFCRGADHQAEHCGWIIPGTWAILGGSRSHPHAGGQHHW